MATIMIKVTEMLDKDRQWWVNPDHIMCMTRSKEKDSTGKEVEGTTIIFSDDGKTFVNEHPEEIIRRINWAAAKSDQVQCGLMSSFLEREEQMAEEKANAEGVSNHNPEG